MIRWLILLSLPIYWASQIMFLHSACELFLFKAVYELNLIICCAFSCWDIFHCLSLFLYLCMLFLFPSLFPVCLSLSKITFNHCFFKIGKCQLLTLLYFLEHLTRKIWIFSLRFVHVQFLHLFFFFSFSCANLLTICSRVCWETA